MQVPKFTEFRKISRLSRDVVITEKIDGTNASILISDTGEPFVYESGQEVPFLTGSRTRWIQPENDNYGFAKWALVNAQELLKLGPGQHFGEWWGSGIQRGYGLLNGEKRFSLFNTGRWAGKELPGCVSVVPELYKGLFDTMAVELALVQLMTDGSVAAPGFMKPEGVVVYHSAGRMLFKKTIEKDSEWKGKSQEVAVNG